MTAPSQAAATFCRGVCVSGWGWGEGAAAAAADQIQSTQTAATTRRSCCHHPATCRTAGHHGRTSHPRKHDSCLARFRLGGAMVPYLILCLAALSTAPEHSLNDGLAGWRTRGRSCGATHAPVSCRALMGVCSIGMACAPFGSTTAACGEGGGSEGGSGLVVRRAHPAVAPHVGDMHAVPAAMRHSQVRVQRRAAGAPSPPQPENQTARCASPQRPGCRVQPQFRSGSKLRLPTGDRTRRCHTRVRARVHL